MLKFMVGLGIIEELEKEIRHVNRMNKSKCMLKVTGDADYCKNCKKRNVCKKMR